LNRAEQLIIVDDKFHLMKSACDIFDPILHLIGRFGWLPYYLGHSYTKGEMCAELEAAGFEVRETTSLVHHPRLVGVAVTRIVNRLGWAWLQTGVRRAFLAAERLENTPLKYFFGCWVAAFAVPLEGHAHSRASTTTAL
jgi:hypothetical protein